MTIKINTLNTRAPEGITKSGIKDEFDALTSELKELVTKMYANKDHNLLIVLQGMDSSGKDGVSKAVFSKVSPTMVSAYSFRKPTDEEFAHDFLWRVHKHAPEKGKVQIFIRSHYEDILIQRVHKWIDEDRVDARMRAINAWERLLVEDNNTTVLKFYLHLSHERQGEKLQERIDDPDKNWKHNPGDWEERKLWDEYRRCYEDCINRSEIPWIITPVDSRSYRNYFIASKVLETLKSFDMKKPTLEDAEEG